MPAIEWLPEVGIRTLDAPVDPGVPTLRTRRGEVVAASVPPSAEVDPYDVRSPAPAYPVDPTDPEQTYSGTSRARDYYQPATRDPRSALATEPDPFDVTRPPSPEPSAAPGPAGYSRSELPPAAEPSLRSRLERAGVQARAVQQRSLPADEPFEEPTSPYRMALDLPEIGSRVEQLRSAAQPPTQVRGGYTAPIPPPGAEPLPRYAPPAAAPGATGGGSAPAAPAGQPAPVTSTGYKAFGDSLAGHLIHYSGIPGSWNSKAMRYEHGNTAVGGYNPTQVFDLLKDMPEETIRGSDAILSTGASNVGNKRPLNQDDITAIVHQVNTLKAKGANTIALVGVGQGVDPNVNGILARIAQQYQNQGVYFTGPVKARGGDDGGIHAENYNQLRDQIAQARPSDKVVPATPAPTLTPPAATGGAQPALQTPGAGPAKINQKYTVTPDPFAWLQHEQPEVAGMIQYAANMYGIDPHRLAAHGAVTGFGTDNPSGNIMGITEARAKELDPEGKIDRNTMKGAVQLAALAVYDGDRHYGSNTAASISHYGPGHDNDHEYVAKVLQQPPGTKYDFGTATYQPGREGSGSTAPPSQAPPGAGESGPTRLGPAPAQGQTPEKYLARRVMNSEGTGGANPWLVYGGDSFTPGAEHPGELARRGGPEGVTHAAGPGQWQPGTWDINISAFQNKFGRRPVFSSMDDQEQMIFLNAARIYPGGENKLRSDIQNGQLNVGALSDEWRGFRANDGLSPGGGGGSGRVSTGGSGGGGNNVHPAHSYGGDGGLTPNGIMGAANQSIQTGNPVAWTDYLRQNAPGMGMSEAWEHARGMMIEMFVRHGNIAGARDAVELVNQLAYTGANQNLMMAYKRMQMGDLSGAAAYLNQAHDFAPDGTTTQYGISGNQLIGRRIEEATGRPVGNNFLVTSQGIAGMIHEVADPNKFHDRIEKEQKALSEAKLKNAQAGYYQTLNPTRLAGRALDAASRERIAAGVQAGQTTRVGLQTGAAGQRADQAATASIIRSRLAAGAHVEGAEISAGANKGLDQRINKDIEDLTKQDPTLGAPEDVANDPQKLTNHISDIADIIGGVIRTSGEKVPMRTAYATARGLKDKSLKLSGPFQDKNTGDQGYQVVDKAGKPVGTYLPRVEGDRLLAADPTAAATPAPTPVGAAAPSAAIAPPTLAGSGVSAAAPPR